MCLGDITKLSIFEQRGQTERNFKKIQSNACF